MSRIPEDLYLPILLRLPVKSTFVCKCVCKSWFSIISDPTFPKMHLDFTPNIYSNLMLAGYNHMYSYIINSISCDSLDPSMWRKTEKYYPYESMGYAVRILGSCRGLVSLVFYDGDAAVLGRGEFFFCIWNPATREYKRISKPTDVIFDFLGIYMYAFGYDHMTECYKLFIGVNSFDEISTAIYVYTVESDSWRNVVAVPYRFFTFRKSGVLVNGHFHYLVHKGEGDLIVSLDISKERFTEMELSTELKVSQHLFVTEAVLQGCLCVLAVFGDSRADFDTDERFPPYVNVWVMQDYGVQKSWTRRYVTSHEVIISELMSSSSWSSFRFIASSMNGEILLMIRRKLVLYDTKDGSAVELYMGSVAELYSGVSYFESLVSVNSGTYVVGER